MDLYIVRCALEIKTREEIRGNSMIEMKNVGLPSFDCYFSVLQYLTNCGFS